MKSVDVLQLDLHDANAKIRQLESDVAAYRELVSDLRKTRNTAILRKLDAFAARHPDL